MSRLIDADHFIATLDTVVQKHESVLWQKIAETMKFMIEAEAKMFPTEEIIHCKDCKYGEQDKDGWWYCGEFGCVFGDGEKGDGFCSDAERREDAAD